jgi:low temperature requirement protein LtrA
MLASLFMAIAIPEAFGDRALLFGASYAGLQILRNLFAVVGSPRDWPLRPALTRILIWSVAVGVMWVVGGLLDGAALIAVWIVALVLDYAGPYAGYWNPVQGRSETSEWEIESAHFSERFQLFIIIALGESIMATGGTFAESARDASSVIAFLATFVGSVAMWWIYFNSASERGHHRIAHSLHAGRLASTVYTYMHTLIVAGIIVSAVADDLVLEHPAGEPAAGPALAVIVGGPALFLVGTALFQASVQQRMPWAQIAAVVALGVLAAFGSGLEPLPLALSTLVPLLGLAAWDSYERLRR